MNLFIMQSAAQQIAAQHLPMGQMESLLHQRSNRWRPPPTSARALRTKTLTLESIVLSSIQLTPSFQARLLITVIQIQF